MWAFFLFCFWFFCTKNKIKLGHISMNIHVLPRQVGSSKSMRGLRSPEAEACISATRIHTRVFGTHHQNVWACPHSSSMPTSSETPGFFLTARLILHRPVKTCFLVMLTSLAEGRKSRSVSPHALSSQKGSSSPTVIHGCVIFQHLGHTC